MKTVRSLAISHMIVLKLDGCLAVRNVKASPTRAREIRLINRKGFRVWKFKDILGGLVLIGGLGVASNMSLVKEKTPKPETVSVKDAVKPKADRQPQSTVVSVSSVLVPSTHHFQISGSSTPETDFLPVTDAASAETTNQRQPLQVGSTKGKDTPVATPVKNSDI